MRCTEITLGHLSQTQIRHKNSVGAFEARARDERTVARRLSASDAWRELVLLCQSQLERSQPSQDPSYRLLLDAEAEGPPILRMLTNQVAGEEAIPTPVYLGLTSGATLRSRAAGSAS